jgi:hypothetical protein
MDVFECYAYCIPSEYNPTVDSDQSQHAHTFVFGWQRQNRPRRSVYDPTVGRKSLPVLSLSRISAGRASPALAIWFYKDC